MGTHFRYIIEQTGEVHNFLLPPGGIDNARVGGTVPCTFIKGKSQGQVVSRRDVRDDMGTFLRIEVVLR
jgi:hypothetical protein